MKTADLMQEDFESLSGWRRLHYLWLLWTWTLVLRLGRMTRHPWWWNGGRHSDGDPTVCRNCGWVGRVRDSVHGYQDDGSGEDVEGVEECPRCGSEEL